MQAPSASPGPTDRRSPPAAAAQLPGGGAFSAAAELARRVTGARAGLVSLVAPREHRILGSAGMGAPEQDQLLPVAQSICQHVVRAGVPVRIDDVRLDPRLTADAGGGAHTDLGVVAYLGVPLLDAADRVVGTVCALDGRPRAWSRDQLRDLEHVSATVQAEVRLWAVAADLEDTLRMGVAVRDTALDGLVVTDMGGAVREFNPAAERMFGRSRHEVVGSDMAEVVVPAELRAAHRAGVARFAAGGGGHMIGTRTRTHGVRADGTVFPLELTLTTTRRAGAPDAAGDLLVAHVRDRTQEEAHEAEVARLSFEHREAAYALAASEERLGILVESAPMILFAVGLDERFTVCAGAGLRRLRITREDIVGRTVTDVFADRPGVVRAMRTALSGEQLRMTAERDGRTFTVAYRSVQDRDGRPAGIVGVATDVTDDLDRERRLRRFATYDELTGALNRGVAEERIGRTLAAGGRLAVLLIDVDHLKDVNDGLGHAVGDQVLRDVVENVRAAAPGDAVLARLGGDELLLAVPLTEVPGPALLDRVEQLARSVLAAVAQPVPLAQPRPVSLDGAAPVELTVTASVGVALAPEHGQDLPTVLAHADAALQGVKRSGRGTFATWVPAPDGARRRLSVGGRLRRAVSAGALDVHFQPLVRLHDREPVSFEALSRWSDPELGQVTPLEFIPMAEDIGMIDALTDLVLHRSLEAARDWNAGAVRADATEPLVTVAVNLAARQLHDRGLPRRLATAVQAHGLPPDVLVLELTESAAMDDRLVTGEVLTGLSEAGFEVVIDDFGVGYSNLARLRDLSADGLVGGVKLDRSFVSELPSPRAAALVASFLHLSTALGLSAVAEGIETPAHLEALQGADCPLGQGWLFAAAMPAAQSLRWLQERRGHAAA